MNTIVTISSNKTEANTEESHVIADFVGDVLTSVAVNIDNTVACMISDVRDIAKSMPAIRAQSVAKAQSRMEARMAKRGITIVRS